MLGSSGSPSSILSSKVPNSIPENGSLSRYGLFMPKKPIILDFDSTLCAVESLDALASIVLTDDPDAQAKVAEIERLTNLGMSGELPSRRVWRDDWPRSPLSGPISSSWLSLLVIN